MFCEGNNEPKPVVSLPVFLSSCATSKVAFCSGFVKRAPSKPQMASNKLWGGRFQGGTDPTMEKFNNSIRYDKRLWQVDIQGSQAYARELVPTGILTQEESNAICSGLDQVAQEWEEGRFHIKADDEDIHTANERRLKELIGSAIGGKLHTGRSRNDQVATDLRLWTQEEIRQIKALLRALIQALIERAENEIDVLLPGYTHLQRAQPIRWSHYLLSFAWSFQNDLERLSQTVSRVSVMPLGSGALAGNPFPINRPGLAKDLGFQHISPNSLWGVGDRDFVAEVLFWCSLTAVHLSRLAEDLILYSTPEFGYVKLADMYSTGSSLMPQKRNPDSLELLRGKSGRCIGHLTGWLVVLKGLPSTYNKDLQEDKEPLFDALDTMRGCLEIAHGTISTLEVNTTVCRKALSPEMLATDLAYYLVRKNVAFRDAHELAGKCVSLAEAKKVPLSSLTTKELQSVSPLFEESVQSLWDFENSVEQYKAIGGTSKESVRLQIKMLKERVEIN